MSNRLMEAAAQGHQGWRATQEASKGLGAERWKETGDRQWLSDNSGQPYCRAESGEVNINIPFDQLPYDWQAENVA